MGGEVGTMDGVLNTSRFLVLSTSRGRTERENLKQEVTLSKVKMVLSFLACISPGLRH